MQAEGHPPIQPHMKTPPQGDTFASIPEASLRNAPTRAHLCVYLRGLLVDHPCLGEAGQARKVSVAVVVGIEAGDVAGQHAGGGCVHVAGDQGEAHARQRPHAEAAEHLHMGVAASEED